MPGGFTADPEELRAKAATIKGIADEHLDGSAIPGILGVVTDLEASLDSATHAALAQSIGNVHQTLRSASEALGALVRAMHETANTTEQLQQQASSSLGSIELR